MTAVLITGATGVVGSTLVPKLLEETDASLSLLIRARSPEHLEERLASLVGYWRPQLVDTGALERIEALQGDVAQPRLGLETQSYRTLTERLTHIVHSAADVRMNRPIEEARSIAVGSAREVLTLAERCRRGGSFRKLEFVSTIGVGGDLNGAVEERPITEDRGFRNSYEAAKAEAEELVFRAAEGGLPVTVHRPSMVVGDSRTGRVISFQVFYHLCELLSGRRSGGFVPRTRGVRLDTIPCNLVADAIVWASRNDEGAGSVLHLCSGPEGSIEISELTDLVRIVLENLGVPLPRLRRIPFRLLLAGARTLSPLMDEKARRGMKNLPMFKQYAESRQFFENRKTKAMLSAAGIEIPTIDQYLEPVLRYYHEHRPNKNPN